MLVIYIGELFDIGVPTSVVLCTCGGREGTDLINNIVSYFFDFIAASTGSSLTRKLRT